MNLRNPQIKSNNHSVPFRANLDSVNFSYLSPFDKNEIEETIYDILSRIKKFFSLKRKPNESYKQKKFVLNWEKLGQAIEDHFIANAKSVKKKTQIEQEDGTILEKTEIIKQPENTDQQDVIDVKFEVVK